jgi:hypothetical protein
MKFFAVTMALTLLVMSATAATAQQQSTGGAQSASSSPSGKPGTMMLTIFFRHDQSKTVDEINAHLKQTGFDKNFPPPGVEVISWYVMMGIGQVVTIRFPPERLREVNLAIEHGAWGGYRTEFYPTYDLRPEKLRDQAK